jgi:hypothetical protein
VKKEQKCNVSHSGALSRQYTSDKQSITPNGFGECNKASHMAFDCNQHLIVPNAKSH